MQFNLVNDQGPVVRSLVSANRWLRSIKTYRFPWYLTLVSANHASRNPGQEQVAQSVWRDVALRCMALALGFISIFFFGGGVPPAFVACACIISVWCFSLASLGSSSGQRLLCILCLRPRMSSWL